jgi:hypothetical protein
MNNLPIVSILGIITLLNIILSLILGIMAIGLIRRDNTIIFRLNFDTLKNMIVDKTVTKKNFEQIKLELDTLETDGKELYKVRELDSFFRTKFAKFIKPEIKDNTDSLFQQRVKNKIKELEELLK